MQVMLSLLLGIRGPPAGENHAFSCRLMLLLLEPYEVVRKEYLSCTAFNLQRG